MGCTIRLTTRDYMNSVWKMGRGAYWATNYVTTTKAEINMSRTSDGASKERRYFRVGETASFGGGSFTVKILNVGRGYATIEIWEKAGLEPDDTGFGVGKAEITQTNIGPGIVFNVGSNIDYSLRVMNTGGAGKIYGVIGLGYHDKDGNVYFTGRYAKEQEQIPNGEMFTWNADIEVLHKDYAARQMTPHGPAVYFMAGHEENGKIVWDRSEYIPVELVLESGYVDPLDPDGVPDDWAEPIYDGSRPWDFIDDIIPGINKFIDELIPKPEPEPEGEPIDILPFVYIGFMGLVGYILIKNR